MTSLDLESTVRPLDEALAREVDGETLLVSLATGRYYGLDEVGTAIWTHIGRGARLDDVLARLLAEFDVDRDTARDDLLRLAGELCEAGLLEVAPAA